MPQPAPILTVSRLTELLKEVVEDNFLEVVVEGEVSNFAAPASGHFYFVLKDDASQVRCVMFRPFNRLLDFAPENGMAVVCTGRMSLYSRRGELQLMAEGMRVSGRGSLQEAFFHLKETLEQEGLFAAEHKQPLPVLPRTIGIVTSATGAAIRDIIQVLSRRVSGVRILLRPVRVQGEEAVAEICEAIADLNRQGEADVLIVGRGGGSLEDLWAFNEEEVARAIFHSALPVVSAVGHEVDVTIADFVADVRAPTPSAAAELVMKSRLEYEAHLDHLAARLAARVRAEMSLLGQRLESLGKRLHSPRERLAWQRRHHAALAQRLALAMSHCLQKSRAELSRCVGQLDSLSPLRTLARGYAVVRKDEKVVRRADELRIGDELAIDFSSGAAAAEVTGIRAATGKKSS